MNKKKERKIEKKKAEIEINYTVKVCEVKNDPPNQKKKYFKIITSFLTDSYEMLLTSKKEKHNNQKKFLTLILICKFIH